MKTLPRPRVTQIRVGTVAVLLVYLAVTWMLASWLRLTGADLWVFRLGLGLLGALGAALVAWYFRPAAGSQGSDDDLDAALATARAQLRSGGTARGGLGKLPLIVVLGPPGSAKTTTVVRAGVEADLLAGDVFQGDRTIGPTDCVNVWYTQGSVLVEAGGRFGTAPDRWSRLVKALRPARLLAVLTGRPQAPRSVLVCFSCEEFLVPGAQEKVMAAAREWREVLLRVAGGFGSQVPVYVVFTKADRLPFFAEYTQHIARDEALRPLGASLRWPPRTAPGVYAEREFARVTDALQRVMGSLGAFRSTLLDRDQDTAVQAGMYEFPREFSKISALATQFLVELCKPSQLHAGPVLRGFYFSGVRAITVSDVAASAPVAPSPAPRAVAATQIFGMRGQEQAPVPAPAAATRRAPQWLFLTRLFADVLLRDRAAPAAAQGSVTVNVWRRVLVASAAVALVVFNVGIVAAWIGSGGLAARAHAASVGLAGVVSNEPDLPTELTLRNLDDLRRRVIEARDYGGGLFSLRRRAGRRIHAELEQTYLERFTTVLLAPARTSFQRALAAQLDPSSATADRGVAYGLLKAYLAATQFPDRLTDIAPVVERWQDGRPVDTARLALARAQFEFYAHEFCPALSSALSCASEPDAQIVRRTRTLLRDFAGPERVYAAVLASATRPGGDADFAAAFPRSSALVVNTYRVPSAFTAEGWAAVQQALGDPERLLQAEEWVVGEAARVAFDSDQLVAQVRARYAEEYTQHWVRYLSSPSIAAFGSLRDAASRLERLAGSESPLLQLLALASRNTAVDSLTVGAAFQPVHAVMPPDATERFIVDANKTYIDALGALQVAIDQAGRATPDMAEQLTSRAMEQMAAARQASQQIARGFNVDGSASDVGDDVRRLLNEPVSRVERLLGDLPRATANARGAAFCADFDAVRAKFPFTPSAAAEATIEEFGAVFRPGNGALWRYYEESLRNALVQSGTQYVAAGGGGRGTTPQFTAFFNRAAAVSRAFWASPTQPAPRVDFTIKISATNTVPEARLVIDGREYAFSQMANRAQPVAWDGATAREARLVGRIRGSDVTLLTFDRSWALFKLFHQGTWRRSDASGGAPVYVVTWSVPLQAQVVELSAEVMFANQAGDSRAVFAPDYMSGFTCVRNVMR